MSDRRNTRVDLTPSLLLHAYSIGVFPMADSADDDDIFWIEPEQRGIFPLDGLHVSRSLKKTLRQDKYTVTTDLCFPRVLSMCAEAAPDRTGTWINTPIFETCVALHRAGYAHSVECWSGSPDPINGQLVGGLYGIALKGAFLGESMFSRMRDASKVALVHLVARLKAGNFSLLDTQFITPHLASLGAQEITKADYQSRLHKALAHDGQFGAIDPSIGGTHALRILGL